MESVDSGGIPLESIDQFLAEFEEGQKKSPPPSQVIKIEKKQENKEDSDLFFGTPDGMSVHLKHSLIHHQNSAFVSKMTYFFQVTRKRARAIIHYLVTCKLPPESDPDFRSAVIFDVFATFKIIANADLYPDLLSTPHMEASQWLIESCPLIHRDEPLSAWLLLVQKHPGVALRWWQIQAEGEDKQLQLTEPSMDGKLKVYDWLDYSTKYESSVQLWPSSNNKIVLSRDVDIRKVRLFDKDSRWSFFLWTMYRSGVFYPQDEKELLQFLVETSKYHVLLADAQKSSVRSLVALETEFTRKPWIRSMGELKNVFDLLLKRLREYETYQLALVKTLDLDLFSAYIQRVLRHECGTPVNLVSISPTKTNPVQNSSLMFCGYLFPEFVIYESDAEKSKPIEVKSTIAKIRSSVNNYIKPGKRRIEMDPEELSPHDISGGIQLKVVQESAFDNEMQFPLKLIQTGNPSECKIFSFLTVDWPQAL